MALLQPLLTLSTRCLRFAAPHVPWLGFPQKGFGSEKGEGRLSGTANRGSGRGHGHGHGVVIPRDGLDVWKWE